MSGRKDLFRPEEPQEMVLSYHANCRFVLLPSRLMVNLSPNLLVLSWSQVLGMILVMYASTPMVRLHLQHVISKQRLTRLGKILCLIADNTGPKRMMGNACWLTTLPILSSKVEEECIHLLP